MGFSQIHSINDKSNIFLSRLLFSQSRMGSSDGLVVLYIHCRILILINFRNFDTKEEKTLLNLTKIEISGFGIAVAGFGYLIH